MSVRGIDKLTVEERWPGCWSVDADGVQVIADTAADAVRIVQERLTGGQHDE